MRSSAKLALALLLMTSCVFSGEVIERVVARVGHRVVLQSELEDAMHYQALTARQSPGPFTAAQTRQALEQLIDQVLIETQIDRSTFQRTSRPVVMGQLAVVRQQLAATDDATWSRLLERYGLTQQDVEERLSLQLDILRYIDSRFRPNVRIDKRSIETYYQEQFLPELRKSSAPSVPLSQVSGKIEEILIQQRIDELLTGWLRSLRTQEEVQVQ